MRGAQGQGQPFAGVFQPGLVGCCEPAVAAQAVKVEEGIRAALAALLALAGVSHDASDGGAGVAAGVVVECGAFARHSKVQVNAVEQRARQFVAVALDLLGAAAATASGVAEVAARAGVHCRHQLETGREAHFVLGTGDDDLAGLEW